MLPLLTVSLEEYGRITNSQEAWKILDSFELEIEMSGVGEAGDDSDDDEKDPSTPTEDRWRPTRSSLGMIKLLGQITGTSFPLEARLLAEIWSFFRQLDDLTVLLARLLPLTQIDTLLSLRLSTDSSSSPRFNSHSSSLTPLESRLPSTLSNVSPPPSPKSSLELSLAMLRTRMEWPRRRR